MCAQPPEHRFGNISSVECSERVEDPALQGREYSSVKRLLGNGKSNQKANVDRHGTPVGRTYREQQKLPEHQRGRNPTVEHSDRLPASSSKGNHDVGTGVNHWPESART